MQDGLHTAISVALPVIDSMLIIEDILTEKLDKEEESSRADEKLEEVS